MAEFWAVLTEAVGSLYSRSLAVFALSSAVVGVFVVLLDWVGTKLLDSTSLLKLGYGGARTWQSICLWGLGAGLAGYLGGLLELFDMQSTNARLIVGAGWPLVLPRLIALATEAGGEPEQADGEVVP